MSGIENFIRVWPNKGSEEFCQRVIDAFEEIISDPNLSQFAENNTKQFSNGSLGRKDVAIFLQKPEYNKTEICDEILCLIHECLLEYIEEFDHLKQTSLDNRSILKIQRTPPMGGYHVWHHETNAAEESWHRELVWMVYLNDMPPGEAETEFLYQHKRIRPTRGTVLIWPAGMTHVHRGNTVYTQNKYVATGWWYKV